MNDPCQLLSNIMLSGEFDELFEELGIAAPLRAREACLCLLSSLFYDPRSGLVRIFRLALVCIELLLDGRLRIPSAGFS